MKLNEEALKDLGICELIDGELNPVVREYFKYTKYPSDLVSSTTPWCAAAMCAWLERAGYAHPQSARALDFEKYGKSVSPPQARVGDVVVLSRPVTDGGIAGHVGVFQRGYGKYIWLLGGNQGDKVSVRRYPVYRVLAIRRPKKV